MGFGGKLARALAKGLASGANTYGASLQKQDDEKRKQDYAIQLYEAKAKMEAAADAKKLPSSVEEVMWYLNATPEQKKSFELVQGIKRPVFGIGGGGIKGGFNFAPSATAPATGIKRDF